MLRSNCLILFSQTITNTVNPKTDTLAYIGYDINQFSAEYAQEMHELIADDENLEPWVEEKIAVASYMMDQIGHHLQYKKHRGHEDAEGEKGHVDFGHHEDEYEVEPEELEDEEELVVGDDLA